MTDGREPRGAIWRPLLGALVGVLALPLLILLPEIGLPLAYLSLRLLATRYPWAGRADQRLRRAAARVHAWFTGLAWPARVAVVLVLVLVLGVLLWEAAHLVLD